MLKLHILDVYEFPGGSVAGQNGAVGMSVFPKANFKLLTFMTAMILMLHLCALTAEPVRIAEFVHPPFAYQDAASLEARGAEIAILNRIMTQAGFSPQFTFAPFPRILAMLLNGDFDIAPLMMKTPDREKELTFSADPVLVVVPELIVRKESALGKITSVNDLKGLRIGFVIGQTLPAFMDVKGIYILDCLSSEDPGKMNLNKLMAGRLDAVLSLNHYATAFTRKELGILDKTQTRPLPAASSSFYFAVSKKSKAHDKLVAVLNAALGSSARELARLMDAELK